MILLVQAIALYAVLGFANGGTVPQAFAAAPVADAVILPWAVDA
jgi:hypothetical protein